MLRLLQAVRPNPSYAPGGVDNFWTVEDDAGNKRFPVAGTEKNNDPSSRDTWRQDIIREPRKERMDEEASAKVSPSRGTR